MGGLCRFKLAGLDAVIQPGLSHGHHGEFLQLRNFDDATDLLTCLRVFCGRISHNRSLLFLPSDCRARPGPVPLSPPPPRGGGVTGHCAGDHGRHQAPVPGRPGRPAKWATPGARYIQPWAEVHSTSTVGGTEGCRRGDGRASEARRGERWREERRGAGREWRGRLESNRWSVCVIAAPVRQ